MLATVALVLVLAVAAVVAGLEAEAGGGAMISASVICPSSVCAAALLSATPLAACCSTG